MSSFMKLFSSPAEHGPAPRTVCCRSVIAYGARAGTTASFFLPAALCRRFGFEILFCAAA